MGGELLRESSPAQKKTNTEVFEENFPFYLAIGMSYEEFWAGDPKLAQYYRKAYLLKQEQLNNNAWLQGLYIYDAVSTAVYNALRGKNAKRHEYAKQPYDLFKKEKTPEEMALLVEKEQEKAAVWMEHFVQRNKKSQSHGATSQK